jgi:hypothetical protein
MPAYYAHIYNPDIRDQPLPDAVILLTDGSSATAPIMEVARWLDSSHAAYLLTPAQATQARKTHRRIIIEPALFAAMQQWLDNPTSH